MLIGVLLKQAAVALVLSVLLYSYSLIMGTSDAVLPWALKILMIALVTVAVFIYRKPFEHLFSAVGYGVIGSRERAEADLARAGSTARRNTVTPRRWACPASPPTGRPGGPGATRARRPAWPQGPPPAGRPVRWPEPRPRRRGQTGPAGANGQAANGSAQGNEADPQDTSQAGSASRAGTAGRGRARGTATAPAPLLTDGSGAERAPGGRGRPGRPGRPLDLPPRRCGRPAPRAGCPAGRAAGS